MSHNFKKYCLASLCMGSMLFSFADMNEKTISSDHPEKKIITPDAFPVVHPGFDIFVEADFILWTARSYYFSPPQTGVSLARDASTGTLSTGSGTEINQNKSTGSIHHELSPGFKAGIGLDVKHDGWDIYFEYTYLHTSAHAKGTNAQSSIDYAPEVIFDKSSTLVGSEDSTWRLHFNALTWELGRNYFISPKLLLRPSIGLLGSWQKQNTTTIQTSLNDAQGDPANPKVFDQVTSGSYSSYNPSSFWAFGPRMGLNTSWQFNRNWSFFGDMFLSSVWGRTTSSKKDITSQIAVGTTNKITTTLNQITVEDSHTHFYQVYWITQFVIGARWEYWFAEDAYRLRVQAGWDQQTWQNFALQGLTLDFRFDF
jgi:hypothetical protein